MDRGGFELPHRSRLFGFSKQWRYHCYSFFAVSFPFFFFRGARFQGASLAGDELHGLENRQLSSLRQNLAKRPVERKRFSNPEDSQVPSVRKHEKLERRKTPYSYRGDSAILLQRLWFAFFRAVNSIPKNPFFFFVHLTRRFFI